MKNRSVWRAFVCLWLYERLPADKFAQKLPRHSLTAATQVQLVGMQVQWLNGAQGMIEGVKDAATQRYTVRGVRLLR